MDGRSLPVRRWNVEWQDLFIIYNKLIYLLQLQLPGLHVIKFSLGTFVHVSLCMCTTCTTCKTTCMSCMYVHNYPGTKLQKIMIYF